MGAFMQLGLILWKNLILRKRHPLILFLEIIWPIAIFLVVVLVRRASPPEKQDVCHFSPRTMPSGGGYPFLQSFVCNMDNKCHPDEETAKHSQNNPSTAEFIRSMEPLYKEKGALQNMLKDLPKTKKVLDNLQDLLNTDDIKELLDTKLTLNAFIKDNTDIKTHLVDTLKIFDSAAVVEALLHSELNLTKLYELTGYTDYRAIVCDPAQLSQYLVIPSSVTVEEISRSLCAIKDNQVGDIVRKLQEQLDLAAIVKLLAKVKGVMGDYTDAQMLEDIRLMLALMQNSTMASTLLQSIPNIDQSAQWLMQVVKLVQSSQTRLNMQLLQSVMADADPLMNAMFGDAPWWRQAKLSMAQVNTVINWLHSGTQKTQDLHLTLGQLLSNKDETEDWLRNNMNMTSELIHLMYTLELDYAKYIDFLRKAMAPDVDSYYIYCKDPGYVSIYKPRSEEQRSRLLQVQKAFCDANFTQISQQLNSVFNAQDLISQLGKIKDEDISKVLGGLNITMLMDTYQQWAGMFQELSTRLGPLFNSDSGLSLPGLWNSMSSLSQDWTGFLLANNTNDIVQILTVLQKMLEQNPAMWQQTRTYLISTALSMDMQIEMLDSMQMLGPRLYSLLEKNLALRQMVRDFLELDPKTSSAILAALADPKKIQSLVLNPALLDEIACDNARLAEFLNTPGANVRLARDLLCNRNLTQVLSQVMDGLRYTEIYELMERHVTQKADLNEPQYSRRARLTYIYERQMDYVALVKKMSNSSTLWNADPWTKMLQLFEVDGAPLDSSKLTQLLTELQQTYTYSMGLTLTKSMGEMLQNSSMWPTIKPIIIQIYASAKSSAEQMDKIEGLMDDSTPTGRLMNSLLEYGPDLLMAVAEAMKDPIKRQIMAKPGELSRRFCDQDKGQLRELLEVPAYVPIGEIQDLLCNATTLMGELVQVFNKNPVIPEEVDWEDMYRLYADSFQQVYSPGATSQWDAVIQKVNATRYVESFNALASVMQSLTTPETFAMLGAAFMEVTPYVQQNSWSHRSIAHVNELLKLVRSDLQDIPASGLRLGDFLPSPVWKNLMDKQMAILPDAIQALQDSVLHPQKLLKALMTTDFTQKSVCSGINFSDFMTFPDEAKVKELQDLLCSMKWDLNELKEAPRLKKYIPIMEALLNPDPADTTPVPPTNITELYLNFMGLFSPFNYSQTPIFPDAPQLNLTHIQGVGQETLDKLGKLNMDAYLQLSSSLETLWPLLRNLSLNGGDGMYSQMWKMVESYLATTEVYFNFLNAQLLKLNGTENVSILDLLDSAEVRKMIRAQEMSPELTEVFLNGLINMLMDPTKSSELSALGNNITRLCTDFRLFQHFFPQPPGSSVNLTAVHEAICLSTTINVTTLWAQLQQNMEGLSQYVHLLENPDPNLRVNITSLLTSYMRYQQLVTSLALGRQSLKSGMDEEWLNPQRWQDIFDQFNAQLQDVLKEWSNPNAASQRTSQALMQSLQQMFVGLPDPVLAAMASYIRDAKRAVQFYRMSQNLTLDGLIEDLPETGKLLAQLRELPTIYEVLFTTLLKAPAKVSRLMSVRSMAEMCAEDYHNYLEVAGSLEVKFSEIWTRMCAVNYTTVAVELTGFVGVPGPPPSGPANITEMLNDLVQLSSMYGALAAPADWAEDFSWLTGFDWMTLLNRLANSTVPGQTMIFSQFSSMTSALEAMLKSDSATEAAAKEAVIAVEQVLRVMEVMAVLQDPTWLYADQPEMGKLLALMDQGPQIMEILFLSGSNPVKYAPLQLILSTNPQSVCNITDIVQYLTLPTWATEDDVQRLLEAFCGLDFAALGMEMSQIGAKFYKVVMPETYQLNLTATLQRVQRVQALWTDVLQRAPSLGLPIDRYPWMQMEQWQAAFNNISQAMMSQAQGPEMNSPDYYLNYLKMLGSMGQMMDMGAVNGMFHQWQTILDLSTSKVELLINATSWRLSDLFPESPELQKVGELALRLANKAVSSASGSQQVQTALEEGLRQLIPQYNQNPQIKYLLDTLQTSLSCCGIMSADDWDLSSHYSCAGSGPPGTCGAPDSCCVQPGADCGRNSRQQAPPYPALQRYGCMDIAWPTYTSLATNEMMFRGMALMPKLQEVFQGGNVMESLDKFCQTNVGNTGVFDKLPPNYIFDVQGIYSEFCSINFTQLSAEIFEDFKIDEILEKGKSTAPVDWDAFIATYQAYNTALTQIQVAPPGLLMVDPPKVNATEWIAALGFAATQANLTDTVLSSIAKSAEEAVAQFGDDPTMKKVLYVLATLISAMNERLHTLPPGELTVADLFTGSPELQKYVANWLNISEDIPEFYLRASILKPREFQMMIEKIIKRGDPYNGCANMNADEFRDMFQLPASMDTETIAQLSCFNLTLLEPGVLKVLGIDQILARLSQASPGSLDVDWKDVVRDAMELTTSPYFNRKFTIPEFDVERMKRVLNEVLSKVGDAGNMYNILPLLENVYASLGAYGMQPLINTYMNTYKIFMDYLNDLASKFEVKDQTLDLASLFKNSTSLRQLLQVYFSPQHVTQLMGTTVNAQTISELFTLSEQDLAMVLCSPTALQRYFIFPATANVSDVSAMLCATNFTALKQELMNAFSIDQLIKQVSEAMSDTSSISLRDFLASYNTLQSRISRLTNTSVLTLFGTRLDELFQYNLTQTSKLPELLNTLQGKTGSPSSPQDALLGLVPVLEQMDSNLKDVAWWRTYRAGLVAANHFMNVLTNKVKDWPAANMTLADLLKDAPYTQAHLQRTFALTPEFTGALLRARVDVTKMVSQPDPSMMWCDDSSVVYATEVDRNTVQSLVCSANYSAVFTELAKHIEWDELRSRFAMAENDTNFRMNWTEYLLNSWKLNDALTRFFTNASFPSYPQFFLYDGDINAWMERLNTAFVTPSMSDPDTLRWLGQWLQQQMSDPRLAQFWQSAMPFLQTYNYLADVLNNRLESAPLNVTLKDILKNETYLRDYIAKAFADYPDLIAALIYSNVDINKVLEVMMNTTADSALSKLLCSGAIVFASRADEEKVRGIVCNANFTQLEREAKQLFDWDKIIMQFGRLSAANVSATSFNWTQYLFNMAYLQQNIAASFRSPVSPTDFFLYHGNLTEWMSTLNARLLVSPGQIAQLFDSSLERLVYSLPEALEFDTNLIAALTATIKAFTAQLKRVLQDDRLTLSDLLADGSQVREAMVTTLNLDPRVVAAFLNGQMDRYLASALMSGQNVLNALCSEPLSLHLTLPEAAEVTADDVQRELCAVNATAWSQLLTHWDMAKVVKMWSDALKGYPVGLGSNPAEYGRSMRNLTDLVLSLKWSPVAVDKQLQDLFNLTKFLPAFSGLMEQTVTQQLSMGMKSLLALLSSTGLVNQPGQQSMMSLYATILKAYNEELQLFTDQGMTFTELLSNPSTIANIYRRSLERIPQLQKELLLGNISQLMDRLSRVEGFPELVCDAAKLKSMLNGSAFLMPPYIEMTKVSAVLCNSPPETWVSELKQLGLLKEDLILLDFALNTYLQNNYTSAQPPQTNANFEQELQKTMKLLEDLNKLEYFGRWQDVLAGLNTTTKQNALMAALQGLIQGSTSNMLGYLESLSASMRNQDFWRRLETDVYSTALVTRYINQQLTQLKDGQTMQFGKLFPDQEAVKRLLDTSMSPVAIYQLLAATFNPTMLVKSLDPESFASTVCDDERFGEMFTFPHGVDVGEVQRQLCAAARNSTLFTQQLMALTSFRDFYAQLLEVQQKGYDAVSENPWKLVFHQMETLYKNVEMLMKSMNWTTTGGLDDLLGQLSKVMQGASNVKSYSSLCMTLTSVMDNSVLMGQLLPWLAQNQQYMTMEVGFMRALPELDDVMCGLDGKNLTQLYRSLSDTKLMQLSMQAWNMSRSGLEGLPPFDCSRMMDLQEEMNAVFNESIYTLPGTLQRAMHCIANTSAAAIPALSQLDGMINYLNQVSGLLASSPDFNTMSLLTPYLDDIIRMMMVQKPVAMALGRLVSNTTDLASFLAEVVGLAPGQIQTLLQSSVNLHLVPFANATDQDIKDILCDSQRLERLIVLPPGLSVNMSTVSEYLCGPQLNATIAALKRSVNVGTVLMELAKIAPDYSLNTGWLTSLAQNINKLTKDVSSVLKLTDMVSGLDKLDLVKLLGELQTFFNNESPERIFEDIHNILNDLDAVLTDDVSRAYLEDMKTVAKGIQGLNVFKDFVPPDVAIGSLMNSREELKTYLVSDLKLKPEVAEAILGSSLSYTKMMNLSSVDLKRLVCDPNELKTLLNFDPSYAASAEEVSEALCKMDAQDVTDALNYIVRHLKIGKFIQDFISMRPDEVLKRANISMADIHTLTSTFQPLKGKLKVMATSLKNITDELDFPSVSEALTGEDRATAAIKSLSSLMCGSKSAFDVEDSYGTSVRNEGPNQGASSVLRRRKREVEEWKPSQFDEREMNILRLPFCKDLYKSLVTRENGYMIWAYLKPLLRGKVTYAPTTPLTDAIMEKATGMFSEIATLKDFLDTMKDTLNTTAAISRDGYEPLKKALSNPFVSGAVTETLGFSAADLLGDLESISGLDPADVDKIITLADLAKKVSTCVQDKRLVGFKSEVELEKYSQELARGNNLLAGIVFMDMTGDSGATSQMPKHIKYKIRMDIENVPLTNRVMQLIWKPDPEANFATDMRYMRGFMQMQDQIEQAILELHIGENVTRPTVQMQQFPHSCYTNDDFQLYISSYFFPIIMTLAWLVAVGSAIRNIVYDKEKRLEETLKIMGLKSGVNWLGWFLNTFIGMLLMSFIVVLFLKLGNLMPYSDPVFLFVFLADFSLSTTMMCYLVSVFFNRATLAALTGVMIYLISYLPFIIVVTMEQQLVLWHKIVLGLFSTCAFSQGSLAISRQERRGIGIQWSNANEHYQWEAGHSMAWTCYMMLIDAAIYGLVGWYINNVFPGKYGVGQPWYFPLSPTYWGCRKRKTATSSKYNFSNYGPNKSQEMANTGVEGQAIRQLPSSSEGTSQSAASSRHASASKSVAMVSPPAPIIGPGEIEPVSLPIGISMHSLRKTYKGAKKVAVDDLSANFYRGHITAFLGQNGAGKTSTINVLTGLYQPSAGTAFVEGREIVGEMSSIREDLGICPQFDVLFDFLTVYEHLDMYISLKGKLSRSERKKEIYRMLDMTGLRESRNTKVCQLSGGQRRRLSVALAFAGGSRVVILDEPTSGVDPAARRNIWDLIVQHREGRTIVLCTHHLDEADILGDRVIIMHQGKLVCRGSPLFLKNEYGSGYHLTMAKKTEASDDQQGACNSANVLSFVRRYVPEAQLAEEIGSEMTFILPTDRGQALNFPRLFGDLDVNLAALGVNNYGVSDTTLEEVFLKLTRTAQRGVPIDATALRRQSTYKDEDDSDVDSGMGGDTVDTASQSKASSISESVRVSLREREMSDQGSLQLGVSSRLSGCGLKLQQFGALMAKRFHHHKRDYRFYLSQIVLPCLFMCLAMGCTLIKPTTDDQPSILLTPDLYNDDDIAMFFRMDTPSSTTRSYVDTMLNTGIGTTCMAGSELKHLCTETPSAFKTDSIPSGDYDYYQNPRPCTCEQGRQVCPEGASGFPMPYMSTATGNHLYNLTSSNLNTKDYLLRSQRDFTYKRFGGWTFDSPSSMESAATVWFNNKGHHAMPAFYNALSNMVLRASMEDSADGDQYGISAYNHPLSLVEDQLNQQSFVQGIAETGIALTILCAFCFVPAGYTIYLIAENINKEKRLQFICGVGTVMYWMTALLWDMMSYLLTVALATAIAAAFQISVYTDRLNLHAFVVILLLFGWAAIPLMYLLVRMFKETSSGYMVLFLVNLIIGITTTATVFLLSLFLQIKLIRDVHDIVACVFMIFPQFCIGDALIQVSKNQFLADINKRFHYDSYKNPFTFEMIAWNLIAMAIQGFVFMVVNIIIEAQPCQSSRSPEKEQKRMDRKRTDASYTEDEDVSLERQRVVTGGANQDLLLLHNLKKVYHQGLRKVRAVNNVTVGIPEGECFGLLGVNGAGKTTTFNMITGEVIPTAGAAKLHGKKISEHHPNMHQAIGYCPQFDALDPMLTVWEVLVTYSRLQGILGSDRNRVCRAAVHKLGLDSFQHKTVKNLSGGTRRKLSTAVALLGDPKLVLMDEPTTGMDPHTRRMVWNNILKVIKDNRSVVLTSHSMAECDALCTRMAIMVNGSFMCLGSGQHLKNKFGTGYTVSIRANARMADLSDIIAFMNDQFPSVILKDHHLNQAEFEVPRNSTQLAHIFSALEAAKEKLDIQDYSVTQTTLDQVFLNFAKHQTDGVSPPTMDPQQTYTNAAYIHNGDSGRSTLQQPRNTTGSTYTPPMRQSLRSLPPREDDSKPRHAQLYPALDSHGPSITRIDSGPYDEAVPVRAGTRGDEQDTRPPPAQAPAVSHIHIDDDDDDSGPQYAQVRKPRPHQQPADDHPTHVDAPMVHLSMSQDQVDRL